MVVLAGMLQTCESKPPGKRAGMTTDQEAEDDRRKEKEKRREREKSTAVDVPVSCSIGSSGTRDCAASATLDACLSSSSCILPVGLIRRDHQ